MPDAGREVADRGRRFPRDCGKSADPAVAQTMLSAVRHVRNPDPEGRAMKKQTIKRAPKDLSPRNAADVKGGLDAINQTVKSIGDALTSGARKG